MSDLDFHEIVEEFRTYQNPTSEEKLDRLIDYCAIEDGHSVLDPGCGKAWLRCHRPPSGNLFIRWPYRGNEF